MKPTLVRISEREMHDGSIAIPYITEQEARQIAEEVCEEKIRPLRNAIIRLMESQGLNVIIDENGDIKGYLDW